MRFTTRQLLLILPACAGCRRSMAFVSGKDYAPGIREVTHKCPECKIGCISQVPTR